MPRLNTIQIRRGTTAEWVATDSVLLAGEPAYDSTGKIIKIGDGVTTFCNLEGYGISYWPRTSIIGVEWDTQSSNPALRQIDVNGNTVTPTNAFWQTHSIFANMVRVQLNANGTEAAASSNGRGDGLTLTNNYIMTKIPRVYVKCDRYNTNNSSAVPTVGGRYQRWWISPLPQELLGFVLHPAFYQQGFTTPATKLYIGSYDAYNIGSKSGQAPYVSATMQTMHTAATTIGTGWGILDIYDWGLLQWLFYIRFNTFHSQSILGPGRSKSTNTSALASGEAQGLLDEYGNTSSLATDIQAMAFYGIENLWGNVWQYIIGINYVGADIRIVKPDGTGTLAETLGAGSYVTGSNLSIVASGIYPSAYHFVDPVKYLFISSNATGGSSTTYLCDGYWAATSAETYIVLAGGAWNHDTICGVGCLYASSAVGLVLTSLGARLRVLVA